MLRSNVQRSHVPSQAGVYQFKSGWDRLLYIWKAKNIKKRLQQYFMPSSLWKQDMVAKAQYVERFPTDSEEEALILETQMIKHHTPPYNNLIKGNSAYIYIKIDDHPFPRIRTTRYKKNDWATYIGPKSRHRDIKNFLRIAKQVFQWRSCSNKQYNSNTVCSDYFFWQCWGQCAYTKSTKKWDNLWAFIAPMDYDDAVQQSKETMRLMRNVFSGRINHFQETIRQKIDDAVAKQHFERAAKLKEVYVFAQQLQSKQTVIIDRELSWIYCHLQKHWKYYIWVVLSLTEWRIIDIIGHHEHSLDITKQELISQIEREYSVTLTPNKHAEESRYAFNTKRVWKAILKKLHANAQRFISWYTHSRFASKDPEQRTKHLKKIMIDYHLPKIPEWIECIDISHFSWEYIVWGLAAMQNWILNKNRYRKYKLKTVTNNDDYKSIEEVVIRKFHPKNADTFPDLFIIDGWINQLNVVKKLKENNKSFADSTKNVTFASIWKWEARSRQAKLSWATELFHVLTQENTIRTEPITYTKADQLLILLRDESHRFANQYRKHLHSKEFAKE